ncbi:hypothetical protein J4E81_003508 [Alternaria sp. BMP 2799]|nr:hypothetical protein J4E81_003508 [Alternaria sp. BMP 2799]
MSKAAEATGIDYTGWDEQKALAAIAKAVAVWLRHDLSFIEIDYPRAKRNWKNGTIKKYDRRVLAAYEDDDIAGLAIYNRMKPRYRRRVLTRIRQGERRKKISTGGDHYEPGM